MPPVEMRRSINSRRCCHIGEIAPPFWNDGSQLSSIELEFVGKDVRAVVAGNIDRARTRTGQWDPSS